MASRGGPLDVGDVVTVRPGGVEIEVVGLADEASFSVTQTLFVSYATYEEVQLAANPDARGVVPSAASAPSSTCTATAEVADRITAEVGGVEGATRDRAVQDAPGVSAVTQSFGIVLLLTYVVATIVIGFFFLILTVQKEAALTLLRATGATAGRLVASLAVQVLAVVGAGFAVGVALAVLALQASSFEVAVRPGSLAMTAALVLVLAVVACIGAGRRIARLDPADAMVHAR